MPERVLRLLRLLGGEPTAEELADVLWLADRVPTGAAAPLAVAVGPRGAGDRPEDVPQDGDGGEAAQPGGAADTGQPGTAADLHAAPELLPPRDPEPADGLSDGEANAADEHAAGESPTPPPPLPHSDETDRPRALPIRVPNPRSLPGFLMTARALRPLKQHRPDPLRAEFDEAATVAQIAHTGLIDVVTRPVRERWLDLALVVDDSPSMLLWQQLCTELRALFERLGAFRRIQVWGLRLRAGAEPVLSPRPFARTRGIVRPESVCDPAGRTMTLVISDGAGPGWWDGQMRPVLARWAAHGPTAVLHALPPRMWDGSGLPAARWSVQAPYPGAANATWRVRDPLLPAELSAFGGTPVPVLEPDPRALAAWVRLTVTGGGGAGLWLWDEQQAAAGRGRHGETGGGAGARGKGRGQAAGSGSAVADAARRVRDFRRTVSPEAYRLAAHLAAVSPLTVPVMRLVASSVPWQATTTQLAEVFLGGLMQLAEAPPAEPDGRLGSVGHQHRVYSFPGEARDILLDALPTAQVIETTRRVSRQIAELAGRAPDFPAWLSRPDGTDTLPEHAQGFAWLGAPLLERLGLAGLGTLAPDWAERPPVPEESASAPESPTYPYPTAPFVGFSPRRRPEQGWKQLGSLDPRELASYVSVARAEGGGPTSIYIGTSHEGVRAAVRAVATGSRAPADIASAEALITNEAAALGRFSHACLPSLLDYRPDGERVWTASSLVIGTGLDAVVTTTGALGTEAALCLAQHLAAALAHAHSAGVVHGRLTARRIRLTQGGPVVFGWHRATVDGYSPAPEVPVSVAADDMRALADIVMYAALGTQWLPYGARKAADLMNHPDVPAPLRAVLRTCLPEATARDATVRDQAVPDPASEPATGVALLSLLRGRVPCDASTAYRFRHWLPPDAAAMLDDTEVHRRTPSVRGLERPGAQVPVEETGAPAPLPPRRQGDDPAKWLRLPGSPRPRRGVRRRRAPEVLEPVSGPTSTVAVIAPGRLNGRSTVAVQLTSALAAAAGKRRGLPIIGLPLNDSLDLFGYRWLGTPPDVAAVFGPTATAATPPGDWCTRTDSNGAHFLFGRSLPGMPVPQYGTSGCRRGMDWIRQYGTVVVDAAGPFRPPYSSLAALLGRVDRLVMATTTRPADRRAGAEQLYWLEMHGYPELCREAVWVATEPVPEKGVRPAPAGPEAPPLRSAPVGFSSASAAPAVTIPYDIALDAGGLVDFASLAPPTRRAFAALAEVVQAPPRCG